MVEVKLWQNGYLVYGASNRNVPQN